jgi:hypothetical protein
MSLNLYFLKIIILSYENICFLFFICFEPLLVPKQPEQRKPKGKSGIGRTKEKWRKQIQLKG